MKNSPAGSMENIQIMSKKTDILNEAEKKTHINSIQ